MKEFNTYIESCNQLEKTHLEYQEEREFLAMLQREEAQTKGGEAMRKLLSLSLSNEDVLEGMFLALNCEHRTNQQNFFRALQRLISMYSTKAGHDLRNEASHHWCNKVSQEQSYLPYI